MKERERDVETQLVQGVKALGGRAYKWVSPGNVGVPDRIVIWPGGQVEFVELKTTTGRVSSIQQSQMNRLTMMQCKVWVLYGADQVGQYLSKRRDAR